jgi:hypothetical protein
MDDDHDPSRNETNGEEPILMLTVFFVVDDEVVLVVLEEDTDLVEADTVLGLILVILRRVPFYPAPSVVLRH